MSAELLEMLGKIILNLVLGLFVTVLPFWFLCKRTGHHPALSFLSIVPLANIIFLFYLAFSKWPVQQEDDLPAETPSVTERPKRKPVLVFIGAVLLAVAPLTIIGGTAYTFTLPKIYASHTLVQTVFSDEAYKTYDKATLESLTQTYSEKITGKPILYETASRLNLLDTWGHKGERISKEAACKILESSVTVYRYRDSIDLITISVKRQDPREAARIANTLARLYQITAENDTTQAQRYSISIIEPATPALRPVSPNLILNVLISLGAAGVFVLLGTPFVIFGLKRGSPPLLQASVKADCSGNKQIGV